MKKVFFAAITTLLIVAGCNQSEKKEDTSSSKNDNISSSKSDEMKALYEQNLATLKTFVADFEKEDVDGQASLVADSAVWSSAVYGDTIHSKKHWMEAQKLISGDDFFDAGGMMNAIKSKDK